MSDPHIFVYDCREPVWESAARDAISFGGLIGTAIALNTLMPPSAWLNATLGFCWFVWLVGVGQRKTKRMTPDETRAWLVKEYPAQGMAPEGRGREGGPGSSELPSPVAESDAPEGESS